jgi:hypothetical protein
VIIRALRRVLRLIGSLLGAVMLGIGTLFQPKTRPDDHWSKSPKVEVLAEGEAVSPSRRRRRRGRPEETSE